MPRLRNATAPPIATSTSGLQLLSDLVESAGGVLEIVSAPGEGTRLRREVPLS